MKTKLNRKQRTMVKRGLLCAWPAKEASARPAPAPSRRRLNEVSDDYPVDTAPTGLLSHSQLKRQAIAQRTEDEQQPTTADGPGEGWVDKRSEDPAMCCLGIKVVRCDDGRVVRFYLMKMKPAAQKKLRHKAKSMKKRIERDDREATKRRVRCLLVMLGKA